jgi:hypothetical protein
MKQGMESKCVWNTESCLPLSMLRSRAHVQEHPCFRYEKHLWQVLLSSLSRYSSWRTGCLHYYDRLCDLVVKVPGYTYRGPGFDSRSDQIFWEVVGLERDTLSLVSTIEELLGRKSSGSGLENREYGRRDPSRWPHGTFYPRKLSLTPPTSGGRSLAV